MTPEILQRHWRLAGPHTAQDINMYDNRVFSEYPRHPGQVPDMDAFRALIDGYDCGIRYMDQHIGMVFDALKQLEVFEDLVVIISADHGENMGELGIYAEHGTADHITCRVPLIVRWPGRTRAGHVDRGLHYQLDLLPTLAELLDRPVKPFWDGRSFKDALENGADMGRDELIVSQCCHVCQRAVRWDDYLYIRTWHDGFHLFPDEQIYNIEEDPHEQYDLASERPKLCREGAQRLSAWHADRMASMPTGCPDPMQVVLEEGGPFHARGQLRTYIERLRASGREDSIGELMRRHPGEFIAEHTE